MKTLRAGAAALVVSVVVWLHAPVPPSAATLDTTPFFAGLSDADAVTKTLGAHLTTAQQQLDRLVAARGPRTIDNTLRLYDEMLCEISLALGPANAIAQLHPDESIRQAADAIVARARTMDNDRVLNRAVYDALAAIDVGRADAETRRYIARELRTFRLSGVDRDAATRQRLAQLGGDLSTETAEFRRNVRDSTRTVQVASAAELDGLPADFIARHKPGVGGTITLRPDGSDYAVLLFAKSADLRKRFFTEIANVAYPENVDVLNRILPLRWEIAHLLGFESWAAYEDSDRMVGSAQVASDFIDRTIKEASGKAQREYQELIKRKQQDVPGAQTIDAWEFEYYRELVRKSSYDFDSQSVRPYFAYARVQQGLLEIATRLYGVTFRPATNVPLWHPSVQAFDVFDGKDLIGRIYFDTHPRPNKLTSGALTAMPSSGFPGHRIPEAVIVAGIPGGQPGDPGLLTYQLVRDPMFHEFGHAIANILGARQRWFGVNRVSEDDFREVCAMLFEHWAWNPAVLATYARHYQTNEPMPEDLATRMRRAGDFSKGMKNVADLSFARLAFDLHARDPKTIDPSNVLRDIMTAHAPWMYAEATHREAGFSHLANLNYSSGYYAYQWSLTIAKDMLATKFDETNLLAPGPAHRLRDVIFKAGGSKPAADLVQEFLGRPFNERAWGAWVNSDPR